MSETPIGEVFASMQTTFPQQPADQQRREAATEIRFGPNDLSQSEQERRAIAAGNRLAEQVMFWHTKDCNVHAPTLKPCSCGLETRLRARLQGAIEQIERSHDWYETAKIKNERLAAAIAERDATIVELRGIIHQAESYVYPGLEGTVIRNLPLSCKNLAKSEQDLLSTIAELRAEVAGLKGAAQFGNMIYELVEQSCDTTLPDNKTDAFITVWQRQKEQIATLQARVRELEDAGDALAQWINNALDDPQACDEYKAVIQHYLQVLEPTPITEK